MPLHLKDSIDIKKLNITLEDIAKGIGKEEELLSFPGPTPEDKTPEDAWRWPDMFLIVIKGERGRFCSYRQLECWMEAVIQLLNRCKDWRILKQLIKATVEDLRRYKYHKNYRGKLGEVLQQQKLRMEMLRIKALKLEKAWTWARAWAVILKACPNEESLNSSIQLFLSQRGLYAEFTGVVNWVQRVGRSHRSQLRGKK